MKRTAMAVVVLCAALAACGGSKKGNDTAEGGGVHIDPNASSGDSTDRSGMEVPPEKMDEIQSDLRRKSTAITRCLSDAVDGGTVPKNTRGKITIELTVTVAGKAEGVKVASATIDSKDIQDCVVRHVQEIAFPVIPRNFETSYTYGMETN